MLLKELKKTRGKKSKRPSEKELFELYAKMTAQEVADHYGVAASTVRAWIAYYRKQEVNYDEKEIICSK